MSPWRDEYPRGVDASHNRTPVCLTIAGSDSGGGAGVQADLKAFAACGVHGTSALTALTAQNTVGVTLVEAVAPEMIVAQVVAVLDDIGVDAVKVGMLGTVETIEAVAAALDLLPARTPVVVDPVMVAESGARLLDPGAQDALIKLILPRATVVTPNVPEARALAGMPAGEGDSAEMEALARAIHDLGAAAVVITGGHRDHAIDTLLHAYRLIEIPGERYPDGAAHGSGCTHSSALAAHLAHGFTVDEAAAAARLVAAASVRDGLRDIGSGPGPVDALGVAARGPWR